MADAKKVYPADNWELESDARTVVEAEQIRADKKKWPKVKKEVEKQLGAAKKALREQTVAAKLLATIPDE